MNEARRSDLLERTALALRDAREAHDIMTIVARGLAHEFRRPCVAYELRDGEFLPVVVSDAEYGAEPFAASSLDMDGLRVRIVTRLGDRDLIPVTTEGQLRALFALEGPAAPLGEEDEKLLRAVAADTALALSNALAFEQLRRYAAEGAALTEAARTLLGFTELGPLADAFSWLAVRLVLAEQACVYGRSPDGLTLIGCARSDVPALPEKLPADRAAAEAVLADVVKDGHFVATPMPLPGASDAEHGGLLVVSRSGAPFDKYESRLLDTLVNLAALAIRNVELYEQSTRANRQLAESNAFKDDLMAMFAHDFKGPLTVISGYCELLVESESDEVRAAIEKIVGQTRRLTKLSEDALALAATQSAGFSLQRSRGDLAAFVRDAVAGLDRGEGRIEVEAPESVFARFDRSRLRHAVENVVSNALKYSSDPVRIRIGRADGEPVVEIADRGIGIPESELERVFVRFGRGTNARRRGFTGSGVGLYIAKKIVEVHGGRLTVESKENVGSTFTITLPLG